jgi:hypothetical protein
MVSPSDSRSGGKYANNKIQFKKNWDTKGTSIDTVPIDKNMIQGFKVDKINPITKNSALLQAMGSESGTSRISKAQNSNHYKKLDKMNKFT